MLFNRRHPPDRVVLERVLSTVVAKDNSRRGLEKHLDSDYGFIYEFDVTPCCYPLHSRAWLNARTPGFFFRCTFGHARERAALERVAALTVAINYPLPAGVIAVNPKDGEVLFKHAVYYEGAALTEPLVRGVLEPSYEFIGMHWQRILHSIFGDESPHNHATHSSGPGTA